MRILWLLLLVPLTGCTDDPSFAVSGSFTQERTEGDIDELRGLGQQHGGDVQIRESSPEQFTVGDLSQEDCGALHAILVEKAYLQDVGACVEVEEGASPY